MKRTDRKIKQLKLIKKTLYQTNSNQVHVNQDLELITKGTVKYHH